MSLTTIGDLLQQLLDGETDPNLVDQLLVQILTQPEDEATKRLLQGDGPLFELSNLIVEALIADKETPTGSVVAVLAYRELLATEEVNDREGAIAQCKLLLNALDVTKYPHTWAQTQLKIGTALTIESQITGQVQPDILRNAIHSLNQALTVLDEKKSPDLCYMAHYDLGLAHYTLWQLQDDWDDENEQNKQAVIEHGIAAMRLMDSAKGGNRMELLLALLRLSMADGIGALELSENRSLIISVVERILILPEAKDLDTDQLDAMRQLLADARSRGA